MTDLGGADIGQVVIGGTMFDLSSGSLTSDGTATTFTVACGAQPATTFIQLSDLLGRTVVGVATKPLGQRPPPRDVVLGALHDVHLPRWAEDGSTATVTCVAKRPGR